MAAKVSFRPLQYGDVAHLARHLRPADRAEIEAQHGVGVSMFDIIARAVLVSSHCWVAADTGDKPVAIFGVAPVSLLSGIGSPWMLATPEAERHPRTLVTGGRRYLSRMRTSYSSLFNYVDARNEQSIRWLSRLGFSILPAAPYGLQGEPFHRFELETA